MLKTNPFKGTGSKKEQYIQNTLKNVKLKKIKFWEFSKILPLKTQLNCITGISNTLCEI